MKTCPRCGKPLENKRRKYCNDRCKYWYNQIRKDKEKLLAPFRKRNKNYFHMVTHYGPIKPICTQGKRVGYMIMGSMSCEIYGEQYTVAEVTPENVRKHFQGVGIFKPDYLKFGDETRIKKEEVKQVLNIDL